MMSDTSKNWLCFIGVMCLIFFVLSFTIYKRGKVCGAGEMLHRIEVMLDKYTMAMDPNYDPNEYCDVDEFDVATEAIDIDVNGLTLSETVELEWGTAADTIDVDVNSLEITDCNFEEET